MTQSEVAINNLTAKRFPVRFEECIESTSYDPRANDAQEHVMSQSRHSDTSRKQSDSLNGAEDKHLSPREEESKEKGHVRACDFIYTRV